MAFGNRSQDYGQAWLTGIAPEASEELRAGWLRRADLVLVAVQGALADPGSPEQGELLYVRERDAVAVIEEWSA